MIKKLVNLKILLIGALVIVTTLLVITVLGVVSANVEIGSDDELTLIFLLIPASMFFAVIYVAIGVGLNYVKGEITELEEQLKKAREMEKEQDSE